MSSLSARNNPITNEQHHDIINQIVSNQSEQSELCAGTRLALCQMSIYYQSRLSGVNHDLSLTLSQQASFTLHFDEKGTPYSPAYAPFY